MLVVCEGDLALIIDENSLEGCWPLGRVLRALPGDNGRVRTADARLLGKKVKSA